jgi:hypothetical protein
MQTAKLESARARALSALIVALGIWLVLAVLLPAMGPAVHGEAAPVMGQAETSPTTEAITSTGGITETPPLPLIEEPTATITPTETPTPTATPTLPPTPEPTATLTATPLPTAVPLPTDTPRQARQHYVRGDSNVVFRWDMLVDSLALGISYAWLIGGLVVAIGLPILLVVLWLRAERRRSAQE